MLFKQTVDHVYDIIHLESPRELYIVNSRYLDHDVYLPEDILTKLQNDDAFLIAFDDIEPRNWVHTIPKFKNLNDVNDKNIIFVSANSLYKLNPNSFSLSSCPHKVFYHNAFFDMLKNRFKDYVPPDTTPSKHFIYLARIDKHFRRYFYHLLKKNNLLHKGIISHNRILDPTFHFDDTFNSVLKSKYPFYEEFQKDSLDIVTLDSDFSVHNIENFALDACVEVINESSMEPGCIFLTEKTLKAFLNKSLFLFLGNQHSLKFLKKLGFKTFNHIFDESYDDISCTFTRSNKVFEQLKKFCELSLEDAIEIKKQNKDILDYNYNHLMNNLDVSFNIKEKLENYFWEVHNERK